VRLNKTHIREITGMLKPITREITGILKPYLRKINGTVIPNLGNSQRKHNENPETTHFIHKLGITKHYL